MKETVTDSEMRRVKEHRTKENEECLRQQPLSLAEAMAPGAISKLQVIDCYPCPTAGIGENNPRFVHGFWV
jgi:hypothetical protein